MAGNTLVTRLLLESGAFDNNLRKSRAQIMAFDNSMKKISSSIGALGATFGLVMGANEAWNKALANSESLADKAGEAQKALTMSVDSFFTSISTGNWTSWLKGLDDTISKAREAYRALDDLDTFKAFKAVDVSQNQAKQAEIQAKLRIGGLTGEQEKKLQQELRDLQKERLSLLEKHMAKSQEAIKKEANAILTSGGGKGVDENTVMQMFSTGGLDKAQKRFEELNELIAKYDAIYSSKPERKKTEFEKSQGLIGVSIKQSDEYKTLSAFFEKEGAIRESLLPLIQEYYGIQKEYNDSLKQDSKYLKSGGKSSGVKGLTSANTFGNDLADTEDVPVIDFELNSLAAKRGLDWVQKEFDDNPIKLSVIMDEDTFNATLEKGRRDEWNVFNENLGKSAKLKELDSIQSAAGSLNSILSQTAGLLSESGNAWGAWGLQAIGTIASVIGQYASLIAMQMASGIAEQSKLIFPYNLAAMAATAGGMISIIASLPKFATGGIVGGSSYAGDNVLIRANSGEMILNKGQQARLMRMLDGAGGNGAATGGNVSFEIKGDRLVGVLNNYGRKTSKKI